MKKDIHGLLLLNKPYEISSNLALSKVKRLFMAKKAGHTGSLDPLATGMLPICFGFATKYSQFLLSAKKAYQVTGRLGIQTETGDIEGKIIKECKDFSIDGNILRQHIEKFIGSISQVPPMYSALKKAGKPLYEYARKGIEVERPARDVTIYELKLLAFDGIDFKVEVVSSKGTYMRTLIEDIGESLGVGAHVTHLHRLYSEPFAGFDMVELKTLEESEDLMAYCLPIDKALNQFPPFTLSEKEITSLLYGQFVDLNDVDFESDTLRIYNSQGEFRGLARFDKKGLQLRPFKMLPAS